MPLSSQADVLSTNAVTARLRRAANLTVNDNSTTAIPWDTEDSDPYGFVSGGGSTLTVPAGLAGFYVISVSFVANAAFVGRGLLIVVTSVQSHREVVTGEEIGTLCLLEYLAAAQTIQAQLYQNSGSSRTVTAGLNLVRMAK